MVTVGSYSFPYEAHIARAKLESEGIPAFVVDEHTINAQWLYSNAMGGVRVQVPNQYCQQAQSILATDLSTSLEQQQGSDVPLCPACGSDQLGPHIKGKKIAFLMFLALHFPLWPYKRGVKCHACGHTF